MLYRYSDFITAQESATPFAQGCFASLIAAISRTDFPCYFAKQVIAKDTLHMAFVENYADQEAMWAQACLAMTAYAEIEREPDIYRVFVLSFDVQLSSWEADDAFLWELLAYLRAHDPEPWMQGMPENPSMPGWSFSFMGMPWFFNVNSPNNDRRKSRNATGQLSMIIQRTDGFDALVPLSQHDTLRQGLRSRIAPYDGQAVSPSMAGEADNPEMIEWIQFHTPNLNTEKPATKCPYHAALAAAAMV
jgi:uncharacterized protein